MASVVRLQNIPANLAGSYLSQGRNLILIDIEFYSPSNSEANLSDLKCDVRNAVVSP